MKNLNELLKGKVVNCQTEDEATEFLSLLHENGYKWINGESLKDNIKYHWYYEETCYNVNLKPVCDTMRNEVSRRTKNISNSYISTIQGTFKFKQYGNKRIKNTSTRGLRNR